jgi:RNA polymerase sigma-70 factor (ECF subfamily)
MSSLADQPTSGPGRDSSVAALVEQFYRSHAGLVRSVCCSILRDWVEAEDAVQQTFLSAQRALINGSSPQDAAAWLATIARHESLARVRARMREPLPLLVELEQYGAAPDVHATATQRYEVSELRGALAQLPGLQREAILLREVRGFSSPEVAAALSVTPHAAESLVFRARRSLRTHLQGAFAGLSPGLWVQPLRELATRAASGGLAAPAAAKVAAISVGTALMAGGAIVGPTVIHRFGHGPRHVSSAPRLAVPAFHPQASTTPATFSASRPQRPVRTATIYQRQASRANGDPTTPQNSAGQGTPGTGESQSSTDPPANGTASQSPPDTGDGNSQPQDTSGSNDNSPTGSTDGNPTGSTDGNSTGSSSTSTGGDTGGDPTPGD